MKHLTKEQRYTISSILEAGHSQKDIALTIDKDKSVISREISRNADERSGEYLRELGYDARTQDTQYENELVNW